MKIMTVGASGYLGSEILHQAKAMDHEALGTTRSDRPDLIVFDLDDESTWSNVIDEHPDVIVWTAWSRNEYPVTKDPFANVLAELGETKLVYVSSDAAFCKRSLATVSNLGDYARRKHVEQATALLCPGSAVFVTGPIYGKNSAGVVDDRTMPLLNEPHIERQYWNNVYKTFVPVRGLARTILANLDKAGQYFVGPPERKSYFDFYVSRLVENNRSTDNLSSIDVTDAELAQFGICADTSYADNDSRLWSE